MLLTGLVLMFLITILAAIAEHTRRKEQHQLPPKRKDRMVNPSQGLDYNRGRIPGDEQRPHAHPYSHRLGPAWRMRYDRAISSSVGISQRQLNVKLLLTNWEQSIAGLLMLSDTNLGKARREYEDTEYTLSAANAFAAIENISRALIHCCGGTADYTSGQEEALRLTLQRFEEEDKTKLEKAIEEVDCATANRQSWKSITNMNVNMLTRAKIHATAMIQSAVVVQETLKHVIRKYFGEETQGYFNPEVQKLFIQRN